MTHSLAVPASPQQERRPMGASFGGAPIPASAWAVVGPAPNDQADAGGAGKAAKARAGLGAFGSLRTPRPCFRCIVPIVPPSGAGASPPRAGRRDGLRGRRMTPRRSAPGRGPILAALLLALAPVAASAQDRPTVIAVNYPLAYFAERLAGEAVEVVLPVPEGRDPDTWRPGVAEIGAVQAADLILLNGAGFAGWTERASLPRARVVDTSRAFEDDLLATEAVTHSHGPEGEHSHEGTASFTWLDLDQAALQAEAVAEALARRLPEEADAIDARLDALRADLAALDEAAHALGPLAEGRTLIVSHPRYQYLGRAYGLAIESVEWDAGAVPDATQLEALAAMASGLDAPVFVWEAEPPAEAREAVAALGLADVVVPDPGGAPGRGRLRVDHGKERRRARRRARGEPDGGMSRRGSRPERAGGIGEAGLATPDHSPPWKTRSSARSTSSSAKLVSFQRPSTGARTRSAA